MMAITLRSTRTPPALSSALSLVPAFSASLIASAQAGPVSFIRKAATKDRPLSVNRNLEWK
jgi:hypothetical protein